jgi:hypothetical protein
MGWKHKHREKEAKKLEAPKETPKPVRKRWIGMLGGLVRYRTQPRQFS